MDIKVREVSGNEEKSVQEVEQELLDKHEEKHNEVVSENETPEQIEVETEQKEVVSQDTPMELKEEDVLSFIKNKYGREVGSMEELTKVREDREELPEDVAAYFKYKKETGRGFDDFAKLQRDLDDSNPDKILRDYLVATEKGLDSEDIDALMEDYSYDEELDEEKFVKKTKLLKKKAIAKAKDYFESEKEKYRVPLESSGSNVSAEDKKALEEYKQYVQQASTYEEEAKRKSDWFVKKTDEVFGSEFKGSEFTVDGDKKVNVNPGDKTEIRKQHETPQNFIKKFLNEDGLVEDAVGYHRALSVAMNPEKFAKFFYEQGKAEAVDDVMRKTKNVNMSERRTPEVTTKGGTQFRAVNPDSGKGLRIKSRK